MPPDITLEDLKKDIEAVASLTKALETKINGLQSSMKEVDTKVSPLNGKVDGILKANTILGKNINSIKTITETHSEKYENLEQALFGLKETMLHAQDFIKDIENRQHKNINNIETLNKDKETIRNELINHISKVNEQFNKVRSTCEKVITHDDEINDVKKIAKTSIIANMACTGIITFVVIFQALGIWNILAKYIQSFAK